jgi:SH3 domain protein
VNHSLTRFYGFFLGIASAAFFSFSAIAQTTQYIDDTVYVPVRSGPSNQHRILHKGLVTGTALEVIIANEDGKWTNIRTGKVDGWIPTHYLKKTPTADILLKKQITRFNDLDKAHKALSKSYSTQKSALKNTKNTSTTLNKDKTQLTLELNRVRSIYSGAIELDQKYQDLLEQHELLRTQNNALTAENDNLRSDHTIGSMVYGALLVIAGMLSIVIIPRFKPTKRHSDWAN